MNKRRFLKEMPGKVVKIWPVSRRYDENGRALSAINDDWRVSVVDKEGFEIQNLRTGHQMKLLWDNYKEFRSPNYLRLRCQVFLKGQRAFLFPVFEGERANQALFLKGLQRVCQEAVISCDPLIAHGYVTHMMEDVPNIAYAAFVHRERQVVIGQNPIFSTLFPTFREAISTGSTVGASTGSLPSSQLKESVGGGVVLDWSVHVVHQERSVGVARLGFYSSTPGHRVKLGKVGKFHAGSVA